MIEKPISASTDFCSLNTLSASVGVGYLTLLLRKKATGLMQKSTEFFLDFRLDGAANRKLLKFFHTLFEIYHEHLHLSF
jgi:hypothetical protein